MDYGMLDGTNGPGIGGGIGADPGNQARVSVYIQVDDPDAYLKKVEAAGGEVLMPTAEVPGGGVTIAMFKDPQGNVMGLVKG
jgi:predicted enzyme related to lactoylglutathione lyase